MLLNAPLSRGYGIYLGDPGLHQCTVRVSLKEFWTSKFLFAPYLTYKERNAVLF